MAKCKMGSFREMFPVLFSPKFWGVVLTSLALYLKVAGFMLDPQAAADLLLHVAAGATGIGVLDSVARKMGK